MLEFLFGKKKKNPPKDVRINEIYTKLSDYYGIEKIPTERKKYLQNIMIKHGYLNYPYFKALEELTPAEILYAMQFKWIDNHIFNDKKFRFDDDKISVLARENIKNSDWIKKEGHDIKLINLAGLKDGNKTKDTGNFIDWMRQLLILPTGNIHNEIFNTTIYLIPFHPREFGCAYLPKSSEVSEKLFDQEIFDITGLDAKEQVKTFITFAQLAGHPVIYDILPQTGRFSKAVLANPEIARWYDIEELINLLKKKIDTVCTEMIKENDADDIEVVKNLFIQNLNGSFGELSAHYQKIYEDFDNRMNSYKIEISNKMLEKNSQIKIHKKAREIVAETLNVKYGTKLSENDITKQIDIIQKLISKGIWPAPGGAWCSAGVPVRVDHIDHIVDKVSQKEGKPISYRAPKYVLNKLNTTLKNKIPYFGTLAEYMLWDDFLKEYHQDMNFDLLWGNDIVSQASKTPENIAEDNTHLSNYNTNLKSKQLLSILKTYNNQDGEFRVDGDESYTKCGIESVIGEEISMPRENNYEFFKKFDAIDRFVKRHNVITEGEAQIILQEEDGFASWMISKEPIKSAFLIIANYKYPTEKVTKTDENGNSYAEIVNGYAIENKTLQLPGEFKIKSEYVIEDDEFVRKKMKTTDNIITIDRLDPGEFRLFGIQKG